MSDVQDAIASDEVIQAFNEAYDAGKDPDEIKVAMLSGGAAFHGVTSIYNKLMIASGKAMSKEDRAQLVVDSCEGLDLSNKEDFEAATKSIVAGNTAKDGITDRSAAGLVRGYAKKTNQVSYKAPRASTGTGGHNFRANFFNWLRQDPNRSKSDLQQLIYDYGTRNVYKDMSFYESIRCLASDISSGVQPVGDLSFSTPESKRASELMDKK